MKIKILILMILFLLSTSLSSDGGITRGPDIGEIYFYGPVVSYDYGIYHSTDFGETVTCMDSIVNPVAITADLTPGGLYYVTMGEQLYYSDNYGQQGSWIYRNVGVYQWITSGRYEGEIYNAIVSHSDDYGMSFIPHQFNGFTGNLFDIEIDNEPDIGYAFIYKSAVADSQYLYISYDNFDNLEFDQKFNFHWSDFTEITRGTEYGEMYLCNKTMNSLLYRTNLYSSWQEKNTFTCPNLPIKSIVGGRQPGELYMLVRYIQSMSYIKHVYIYHSLDYGETFEIYHPISIGPDPHYADFEASPTTGSAPLTVQFTDLSGGDPNWIDIWEWDFDNDGEIDSYEQHPEYTYQDTGYYSVKLQIYAGGGIGEEGIAYREDYIHVTMGNSIHYNVVQDIDIQLSNYPNPFNPITIIEFSVQNDSNVELVVFNIKGQNIKTLVQHEFTAGLHSINWDGNNDSGHPVSSGIYYYKLSLNGKTEAINKCLLLK